MYITPLVSHQPSLTFKFPSHLRIPTRRLKIIWDEIDSPCPVITRLQSSGRLNRANCDCQIGRQAKISMQLQATNMNSWDHSAHKYNSAPRLIDSHFVLGALAFPLLLVSTFKFDYFHCRIAWIINLLGMLEMSWRIIAWRCQSGW